MCVEDYYPVGRRWWLRLHEKGGRHHELPAHHILQDALDAYLEATDIIGDRKGPLFRSARARTGQLIARIRRNDTEGIRRVASAQLWRDNLNERARRSGWELVIATT